MIRLLALAALLAAPLLFSGCNAGTAVLTYLLQDDDEKEHRDAAAGVTVVFEGFEAESNRRDPRQTLDELPVRAGRVEPEPERQRDQKAEHGEPVRDPADGVRLAHEQQQHRTHQRRKHDQRHLFVIKSSSAERIVPQLMARPRIKPPTVDSAKKTAAIHTIVGPVGVSKL